MNATSFFTARHAQTVNSCVRACRSLLTYTDRLCVWVVVTINKRQYSNEQIRNNDDFRFQSPITEPDHFRLVLT